MFVSMRSYIPFKDEPKVHFTPLKKFSLISGPKKSLVKNLDTLIKKFKRFCWTFIDLMTPGKCYWREFKRASYSRSFSNVWVTCSGGLGIQCLPAGLRTPGANPANPLMWLKPPAVGTIPPFPSWKECIIRCDHP